MTCNVCKQDKELNQFQTYWHSTQQKMRTRKQCTECLYQLKLKRKDPNKFYQNNPNYKKCNTCSECKPYSEFTISKNTWDGKSYICCTCKTIYREGFTEYNSEYAKEHYIQHKAEYIVRAIQYKTKRTLATPPWADLNEIRRIYKECPDGYHIDHVIPLQGDLVSGLHVETNLKPIPALDNLRKHNKFEIE